jgi:hypothetical protein
LQLPYSLHIQPYLSTTPNMSDQSHETSSGRHAILPPSEPGTRQSPDPQRNQVISHGIVAPSSGDSYEPGRHLETQVITQAGASRLVSKHCEEEPRSRDGRVVSAYCPCTVCTVLIPFSQTSVGYLQSKYDRKVTVLVQQWQQSDVM